MPHVIFAASRWGYTVQVIDGGRIIHEYSAGNCWQDSPTVVHPCNGVALSQLERWAEATAKDIAKERGIPVERIEYDPDLEDQLREQNEQR